MSQLDKEVELAVRLAVLEQRTERIEGVLVDLADAIKTLARIEERLLALNDHEARLRKLEREWWKLVGIAIGASAAVGWILKLVG